MFSNRPFAELFLPWFQVKGQYKTFHIKVTFCFCATPDSFLYDRFFIRPQFETRTRETRKCPVLSSQRPRPHEAFLSMRCCFSSALMWSKASVLVVLSVWRVGTENGIVMDDRRKTRQRNRISVEGGLGAVHWQLSITFNARDIQFWHLAVK